jgi:catechol 2,3-dioxygenase-like lactoylglutathione lyase family enzyme
MGIGLTKIKHVKIPVTDVQRSVTWYQSLLDLELYMEFVEQGVVRGASLLDRDGGYEIALRDREVCASRPSLAGFDVFALAASSRAVLEQLAERCDRLGAAHSGVREAAGFGAGIDVRDPDGTVVRVLWRDTGAPDSFLGVEYGEDGQMTPYFTPRLTDRNSPAA